MDSKDDLGQDTRGMDRYLVRIFLEVGMVPTYETSSSRRGCNPVEPEIRR